MDSIEMLKGRRSIRKYKNKVVPKETLKEIVEIARFAPSWANFQIARYNFISDEKTIARISESGVNGFVYNQNTLKNTKNLLVLSFIKGRSGKLGAGKALYSTTKSNQWEMFDCGIACQTFCLAAHEKGIGSCIFGVFDSKAIAEIINLPKNEAVGAVITLGYPDEIVTAPKRKEVDEIARF